jgi:hypothetical protein
MKSTTALIEDAYCFLVEVGQTRSQYAFSRRYLNRSSSYFSYLRASGAEPHIEAVASLADSLLHFAYTVAHLRPLTDAQRTQQKRAAELGSHLSLAVFKDVMRRRRSGGTGAAEDRTEAAR